MLSPRGSLSGNGLLSSVLREGAVFISVWYTEGSDTTSYVQMLVTYNFAGSCVSWLDWRTYTHCSRKSIVLLKGRTFEAPLEARDKQDK